MSERWRLVGEACDFHLVRSLDATAAERAAAEAAPAAAWELGRLLPRQGDEYRLLQEVRRAVEPSSGPASTLSVHVLRQCVLGAVQRGHLLLLRQPHPAAAMAIAASTADRADAWQEPVAAAAETLTWIAIELVDTDDRPVPFRRFELILPDGSVRAGALDAQGLARVSGIEPGTCKVRFPDLDGSDWSRA